MDGIAELRQELRAFAALAKQDRANTKRRFTVLEKRLTMLAADEPRRVRAIMETLGVPLGLTLDQLKALSESISDRVTTDLVSKRKDRNSALFQKRWQRWTAIIGGGAGAAAAMIAMSLEVLRTLKVIP